MDGRMARRVAHGLWLATGLLWVTALVFVITGSPKGATDVILVLVVGVPMATYGSVGALVARASPANPIGWLLSGVGLAVAAWMATLSYAQHGLAPPDWIGGLPGANALAWLGALCIYAVVPVALPLFLLYFPDGHLRSKRWRPVLWLTVIAAVLTLVGALTVPWDLDPVRLTPPSWMPTGGLWGGLYGAGVVLIFATSFAGLLALILRYREADPAGRDPLRLLVWMIASMGVATALAFIVGLASGGAEWSWIVLLFAILIDGFGLLFGIPIAAAAAVLTFGLFDVGVVMKKTVVYVILVILFLGLIGFVSLIVNPISVVGIEVSADASRLTTIAAVSLVILVLVFRPVKRLARRIVYGRRSTPYEAMSEFSERLGDAYATQDVLPRMAAILRASTGAAVARVWLRVGRELRPVAAAPPEAEEVAALPVTSDELPGFGTERAFPVRDRGELLGALTFAMPAAEPLSKTGEQLVLDMASQAGLVLRNVRLVEELQESRKRIVTAQDERARKLERDLHDGAQQQLVALSVKQRLAASFVGKDDGRAKAMLDELQRDTNDALENLRDLARGIFPPLLADKGLVAALEAQARKASVPASVDGDGIGRFPQEIEAAVYFCCLEAVQNAAKYASADHVRIRLAASNGDLTFSVADDGAGFDAAATARGAGLTNMRDRIEALGGAFEIRSRPGTGTAISGSIPAEAVT